MNAMNFITSATRLPITSILHRTLKTSSVLGASTKLEPLFDRVLVKKIEAESQTKGGIMLPENQTKTHNGTVVEVGTGARSRDGDFYKPVLKAGDKVMLPEYGGTKVDLGGETHFVYRESDIIGRWS